MIKDPGLKEVGQTASDKVRMTILSGHSRFIIHPTISGNTNNKQNHTKFGTHHYMLVLLLLIEENAKRTMSLDSLVSDIFLLFYLFSSSRWCVS